MVSDMGPLIVMSASTKTSMRSDRVSSMRVSRRSNQRPWTGRVGLVQVQGTDRFIQADSAHGFGQ